jgi:hypothetical protein
MPTRIIVTLAFVFLSIPVVAATESEEPFLRPRVSKNQARPTANHPGAVTTNFSQDPGPGPGTGGASSCQSDTSCRTLQGYQCKAFVGLTCYTWPTADGLQRCAAC